LGLAVPRQDGGWTQNPGKEGEGVMSSRVVKVWRIDEGAFPKHVFQTEDDCLFLIWRESWSGAYFIREINESKFSSFRFMTEQ